MQSKGFKFYIAIPVWGESYVDVFLNTSLPSLMAAGNLPYLCQQAQVVFTVYTTLEFLPMFQHSNLIKTLQQKAEVCLEAICIPCKEHYSAESSGYNVAMYEAKTNVYKDNICKAQLNNDENNVIISLNADMVFSNNFLQKCHEVLLQGKKVVEVVGPRGMASEISEALHKQYRNIDNVISISSRNLLKLWINYIHPMLDIHLWEGDSKYFNCSHLMWPIGDGPGNGWAAHCFFLYPIVLVLPKHQVDFSSTIDANLVTGCNYGIEDAFVVTNSEDLFCCELSASDKFVGAFGKRGDLTDIVGCYKNFGKKYNFDLLQKKIMLSCDAKKADLLITTEKSDVVINSIVEHANKKITRYISMRHMMLEKFSTWIRSFPLYRYLKRL